jgi:hypothetical protein
MDEFNPALAQPSGAPLLSPSLKRLATVVRVLVVLGALALLSVPVWLWSSPEWLRADAMSTMGMAGQPVTIDARALWLNAAVSLPSLATGFFLLWQLWRLFGEYARGHVFGRRALQHLRRLALGVVVLGVLAPLTRTASILMLTLGNAPGQRQLLINISSDDYMRVLFGAVLLAIATVMAEAVRVAEDHAGFV